jgi:hypothetical protein
MCTVEVTSIASNPPQRQKQPMGYHFQTLLLHELRPHSKRVPFTTSSTPGLFPLSHPLAAPTTLQRHILWPRELKLWRPVCHPLSESDNYCRGAESPRKYTQRWVVMQPLPHTKNFYEDPCTYILYNYELFVSHASQAYLTWAMSQVT